MAGEIPDSVTQAVSSTNFKTLGEGPAFYQNLAFADSVSHQRITNGIREAAFGSVVKGLTELDPVQAASVLKTITGNDLAQQMAALLSTVASNQQAAKTAQTTPPVTA